MRLYDEHYFDDMYIAVYSGLLALKLLLYRQSFIFFSSKETPLDVGRL